MRLLGKFIIDEFKKRHADSRSALEAWVAEIEEAKWQTPIELKERYPSASIIDGTRVVFNIKGNNYRIDTLISYKLKNLVVKRIGTHAEYSKWTF